MKGKLKYNSLACLFFIVCLINEAHSILNMTLYPTTDCRNNRTDAFCDAAVPVAPSPLCCAEIVFRTSSTSATNYQCLPAGVVSTIGLLYPMNSQTNVSYSCVSTTVEAPTNDICEIGMDTCGGTEKCCAYRSAAVGNGPRKMHGKSVCIDNYRNDTWWYYRNISSTQPNMTLY